MQRSVEQRAITAEAAHAAVAAACAMAGELGIRVNAAVTDASGVLAAFLRMPGAFLHSVDIAIDKAYTAAATAACAASAEMARCSTLRRIRSPRSGRRR